MTIKNTLKSHEDVDERVLPIMSELEFAKLGDGHVAYIKTMTSEEASRLFPTVEGLPQGIHLFRPVAKQSHVGQRTQPTSE